MTALESFSLDYIQRALVYYDEINPKTGKKCITFTFFNFRTISVNALRKLKNMGRFVKDFLRANYLVFCHILEVDRKVYCVKILVR